MIIVVANQKGGVGKTTTAVNLGTCLAEMGKRVLLVDIDPQGNATSGVGVDKQSLKQSLYDVMIGRMDIRNTIIPTPIANLYLLPSNIDLAGAEVEMVSLAARETVLARAMAPIAEAYDYIIIDCPPSLGLLTLNALSAADQLLVPIQCEYYALEGLSQLMNTVKLVRKRLNPRLEIEGVVLTMFDARTNLSTQVVDEVKRFFSDKVHGSVVPRNVRLGEAPSHGLPITKYDPRCLGAVAYRELAEELIERERENEAKRIG